MEDDFSTGSMSYESEEEELLFGPTMRPNDSMKFAGRRNTPRRPKNLERYLPAILEAARQPDAPEELKKFVRVLSYHLGREV